MTVDTRIKGQDKNAAKDRKEYAAEFRRLLEKWRAETLWCSLVTEAAEHESFRQIVALGNEHYDGILRLIIEEIETRPDMLITALPVLTNHDPVCAADRGNLPAMADAWVQWYRGR